MSGAEARPPLSREEFIEWVRREGEHRYHDHHRYHHLMHDGKLTRVQLQQWVLNRYYYQTRVPIKDAIILSKSEDPAFRRMWIKRIRDHDGEAAGEGGLELWLRLAEGVGLDRAEVASCRSVLPGVRFACDGYVELVRERTLLEAVASSLTEFFSPDLMTRRVLAWRLLHGQLGWVGAFQNAVHVASGAVILLGDIGAISHEAAIIGKEAVRIDCRDVMARRRADYDLPVGDGERVRDHNKGSVAIPRE